MVSEEKIFLSFSHNKSMGANDPRGVANSDLGVWLAGFMQETTKHCYLLNPLSLDLMVSEKKSFEGSLAI